MGVGGTKYFSESPDSATPQTNRCAEPLGNGIWEQHCDFPRTAIASFWWLLVGIPSSSFLVSLARQTSRASGGRLGSGRRRAHGNSGLSHPPRNRKNQT